MDSLIAIRVFRAVVDSESFSAAAARLSISRAAVTKHMNRLEHHLQVRLIERTTRRLHLTEAGSRYYERCTQILEDLEQAEREATQSAASPTGTLRINAPHSFATAHIAPFVAEFIGKHPNIKLDISLTDRFVDLIEEGYDVAIRIAAELPESSLIARPLAPCRFVVCGAPSYLALHSELLVPKDLDRHQCLIHNASPISTDWVFACSQGQRHVARINGNISANSGEMLRAAALNGAGLAAIPTFLVGEDLKAGRLRTVLNDYLLRPSSVFAIYPSRKYLAPKVRAFIDFLGEKYGPDPYWDEWLKSLPAPTRSACDPGAPAVILRP